MSAGPGYAKNPDHEVRVEAADGRWRASAGGQVLADSSNAKVIHETGYAPAIYFPPNDVMLARLGSSEASSYCPFKGQAAYFSLQGDDVAWVYGEPYDEVAEIGGYIAFYPQRVEVVRTDTGGT